MATISSLDLGYYEAPRAAALSGVPERTLYNWAQAGLVVPSISATRQRLWSYGDLLTLRVVRWLRTPKTADGVEIARTKMAEVRAALREAGAVEDGMELPTIKVTQAGEIVLLPGHRVGGQGVLPVLDLFAPFEEGPDLRVPLPRLRIVPGRVAGEPHLVHSRLTTRAVAALARRGFSAKQIQTLYPHEDPVGLREASIWKIDLPPEQRRSRPVALDHNFPSPILRAVMPWLPEVELRWVRDDAIFATGVLLRDLVPILRTQTSKGQVHRLRPQRPRPYAARDLLEQARRSRRPAAPRGWR